MYTCELKLEALGLLETSDQSAVQVERDLASSRFQREWVHYRVFRTRYEAKANLFFYIEVFYNRSRRHSALGYVSPATYEQRDYQQYQSCLTPCPLN
jgi:transposase InsO family protein